MSRNTILNHLYINLLLPSIFNDMGLRFLHLFLLVTVPNLTFGGSWSCKLYDPEKMIQSLHPEGMKNYTLSPEKPNSVHSPTVEVTVADSLVGLYTGWASEKASNTALESTIRK